MIRKFFPLDKNYLLEEAQYALQNDLLSGMVGQCVSDYHLQYNPLGIVDSYSERILKYELKDLKPLTTFYQNLSAVYRYKHGNNQLEFVWDGREHLEKYKTEWAETFKLWVKKFCRQELFIKAVLDLTVFHPENGETQMIENRMTNFIHHEFELKFHRTKGIVKMKVAS